VSDTVTGLLGIAALAFLLFLMLYIQSTITSAPKKSFTPKEKGSSPESVKENIPESIKDDISKYDLGDSLKRLKKMYNDGHLSKVEFEKAKNKLLK